MKAKPLDPASNLAYILVIPKPRKHYNEVGNYRPFSLVNNDLKVLFNIFFNSLASFIGNYIHKDKVGFNPGRQGPDQIRRSTDVISLMNSGWEGVLPMKATYYH